VSDQTTQPEPHKETEVEDIFHEGRVMKVTRPRADRAEIIINVEGHLFYLHAPTLLVIANLMASDFEVKYIKE
jgi:hypothetical protein